MRASRRAALLAMEERFECYTLGRDLVAGRVRELYGCTAGTASRSRRCAPSAAVDDERSRRSVRAPRNCCGTELFDA